MHRAHRRTTKVCLRCKHRKTKCDFKFPACTPCTLAGTECQGYDPTSSEAVPRSLVRSLEGRVAKLEAQLLALQTGPQNVPFSMASKISQATISVGQPSSASYLHSKVSSTLVFRPSCPPLAVVRAQHEAAGSSPLSMRDAPKSGHMSNLIDLKSIPDASIWRMIRNYTEIHLPQYPCIQESMLEDIARRARADELGDASSLFIHGVPDQSGLGHFEYFVLFITLAISANTLIWKAEDQARAASESFFNSALTHLQLLGEHSEINSLQISLLLAHYAHMCPERVDNWTCISDAVRIVLNLALYMEPPESLDVDQRHLRSTLFWVTYGMERSLCTNLRLPLSFPEELITAKVRTVVFPYPPVARTYLTIRLEKLEMSVDQGYDSLFTSEDLQKKSSANHICLYRGLETEVHRVLHLQDEDLLASRGMSDEDWIQDITGRLVSWYEAAKSYAHYGMLEFQHVQFHHLRLRIHRPTPRLFLRTDEDRQVVLEAALVLIQDYSGQEERKRLFYPWHAVHILFETVAVALEACWSSRNSLALRASAHDMLEKHIPQCLRVLESIGQRWDEAIACVQRLQPLLKAILPAFKVWDPLLMADEKSISEHIQGLLFSDGSLLWNHRVSSDNHLFEAAQLFNDFDFEGLEFLQWAPEWDIIPAEFT